MLVPLLIRDLVFRKALVLASIGELAVQTQYYFLEAALVEWLDPWHCGMCCANERESALMMSNVVRKSVFMVNLPLCCVCGSILLPSSANKERRDRTVVAVRDEESQFVVCDAGGTVFGPSSPFCFDLFLLVPPIFREGLSWSALN